MDILVPVLYLYIHYCTVNLMVNTIPTNRELSNQTEPGMGPMSLMQGCGAAAKALFCQVGAGAGSQSQTYGYGSDLK